MNDAKLTKLPPEVREAEQMRLTLMDEARSSS
jgi:hypothetical protein